MSIAENIRNIKSKLPPSARLVAVSKFHPVENILEAYAAGQRIFAESRPQEFLSKIKVINSLNCHSDIEWHFIGHLQTNKLKMVLPYVSMVQSVDSEHLLRSIDTWGRENGKITNVLLEIHISGEETKQGFLADEVTDLLSRVGNFGNVRVCGLMGMATFTDEESVVRGDFERIRTLFTQLGEGVMAGRKEFCELSIGMSDDYMIAVEYGATMVRIGTDIFGPRVY